MFRAVSRRLCRTLAALLLVASLSGCAAWNEWLLPDKGFNDGTAGWTGNLRPKSGVAGAGLSERAREIERNLGVE
jgi:hypothetical protein